MALSAREAAPWAAALGAALGQAGRMGTRGEGGGTPPRRPLTSGYRPCPVLVTVYPATVVRQKAQRQVLKRVILILGTAPPPQVARGVLPIFTGAHTEAPRVAAGPGTSHRAAGCPPRHGHAAARGARNHLTRPRLTSAPSRGNHRKRARGGVLAGVHTC